MLLRVFFWKNWRLCGSKKLWSFLFFCLWFLLYMAFSYQIFLIFLYSPLVLIFFFGTFFPQIEGLLSKREKELGIDPVSTLKKPSNAIDFPKIRLYRTVYCWYKYRSCFNIYSSWKIENLGWESQNSSDVPNCLSFDDIFHIHITDTNHLFFDSISC